MNYGNTTTIIKPREPKPIRWQNRYSNTMEDDKMGRWARIAYAGRFDNMGVFRGKVCQWEIAWVKKVKHEGKVVFTVDYLFPSQFESVFFSLQEAKLNVDKAFKHFIRNVTR